MLVSLEHLQEETEKNIFLQSISDNTIRIHNHCSVFMCSVPSTQMLGDTYLFTRSQQEGPKHILTSCSESFSLLSLATLPRSSSTCRVRAAFSFTSSSSRSCCGTFQTSSLPVETNHHDKHGNSTEGQKKTEKNCYLLTCIITYLTLQFRRVRYGISVCRFLKCLA